MKETRSQKSPIMLGMPAIGSANFARYLLFVIAPCAHLAPEISGRQSQVMLNFGLFRLGTYGAGQNLPTTIHERFSFY